MGRSGSKKSSMNKDAWLATYADMITLVLVFFILLYSMSSIDKEKFTMLVKAFTADPETIEQIRLMETDNEEEAGLPDAATGGVQGDLTGISDAEVQNLDELYEHLKEYIDVNHLESSVQIEKNGDTVFIRFMSSLFFKANESFLEGDGRTLLDNLGQALSQIEPQVNSIRIDGHTAEAPSGANFVDSRELSTNRANIVLKYLEANYIKDPSKLLAVGYGMYQPIAPNDTPENRAKNRRVEILISKDDKLQEAIDVVTNKE